MHNFANEQPARIKRGKRDQCQIFRRFTQAPSRVPLTGRHFSNAPASTSVGWFRRPICIGTQYIEISFRGKNKIRVMTNPCDTQEPSASGVPWFLGEVYSYTCKSDRAEKVRFVVCVSLRGFNRTDATRRGERCSWRWSIVPGSDASLRGSRKVDRIVWSCEVSGGGQLEGWKLDVSRFWEVYGLCREFWRIIDFVLGRSPNLHSFVVW